MSKPVVGFKEFSGWKNCISMSNGTAELIVTTDVGPRIIYYGFNGGPNHLKIFKDQAGQNGGEEWLSYGGHRLWHSPEEMPRTYEKENKPCGWEIEEDGILLHNDPDPVSQMEKDIHIKMDPEGTGVSIDHRITNRNAWPVSFSVWALTVMTTGGRLVIPQNTTGPVYLPNRNISFWTYTRLNDPRVTWLDRYIFLDQDINAEYTSEPENRRFGKIPFKIGMHVSDGWVGYVNHDQIFLKYFDCDTTAEYPDFGHCSFETYTNRDILEIETLSPLRTVAPGGYSDHSERWALADNIRKPQTDDEADSMVTSIANAMR